MLHWSFWVRWAAIPAGIVSTLVFARDGFHLFLHGAINALFLYAERGLSWLLNPLWFLAEPLLSFVSGFFSYFGVEFDLVLQPHWKHVFILMWLLFGAIARSTLGIASKFTSSFRFVTGFLCALVAGTMAGTVHLAHFAVLLWPMSALFAYIALNRAWDLAFSSEGGWWPRQYGFSEFLCLGTSVFLAWWAVNLESHSDYGAGWSSSAGLVILAVFIFLTAVYLLIFGYGEISGSTIPDVGGGRSGNLLNPGRRVGFDISWILGAAMTLTALSQILVFLTPKSKNPSTLEGGAFIDCFECPPMRMIPSGSFVMGAREDELAGFERVGSDESDEPDARRFLDEKPSRTVRIDSFAIGETEVTLKQWAEFVGSTGYQTSGFCWWLDHLGHDSFAPRLNWRNASFDQDASHPVVCLTWWDAQAYATWLSNKTGQRYRLPSEAEWEYVARGGSSLEFFWGREGSKACKNANIADLEFQNSSNGDYFHCKDGVNYTASVTDARFAANEFGVKHMIGNVSEWVTDCYHDSYDGAPKTGAPWTSGDCSSRVIRGGSWLDGPGSARSAGRSAVVAIGRTIYLGFRIAREK